MNSRPRRPVLDTGQVSQQFTLDSEMCQRERGRCLLWVNSGKAHPSVRFYPRSRHSRAISASPLGAKADLGSFRDQGFSQGSVGLFKIDRLFPDYVTQESAGKDTVHFALTEKGHRLVERALKAGRHYYCWQFLSRLNAVHVCASVRVAHRHDGRTIPFA